MLLFSKGCSFTTISFITNCSGLVLKTFKTTFLLIGFSTYRLMMVDTPKGDLMSLMIVGGFGRQFRLNSNNISPASGLMKITEPFS